MKAIAIVELPDDAFDKGRWYLDKIVYTEKESLFDDYANDMWELKPLPTDMIGAYANSLAEDYISFTEGWESYEKALMGEDNG